jgi:hypothetical protein
VLNEYYVLIYSFAGGEARKKFAVAYPLSYWWTTTHVMLEASCSG